MRNLITLYDKSQKPTISKRLRLEKRFTPTLTKTDTIKRN